MQPNCHTHVPHPHTLALLLALAFHLVLAAMLTLSHLYALMHTWWWAGVDGRRRPQMPGPSGLSIGTTTVYSESPIPDVRPDAGIGAGWIVDASRGLFFFFFSDATPAVHTRRFAR
ncbi:hypothetical protein GGS23DRAFT_83677 [Durotheca rogersii]|uniref:uncharacterized protein n=1 Tax=Durotheca rogersii TaxID=419775 RepID=UPI00222126BC|nr:uncharacterized protein GGS23DRAFT_83677 [Durotheca rogersii]KAI5862592.1 hypothetical protein GGS23DRAFT_83677 [Durotheca rogersii]